MPSTYTTSQGDMWDKIAYSQMGSEAYMHLLIQANPQHRETVIFQANVRLAVPDMPTIIASSLPPWKR